MSIAGLVLVTVGAAGLLVGLGFIAPLVLGGRSFKNWADAQYGSKLVYVGLLGIIFGLYLAHIITPAIELPLIAVSLAVWLIVFRRLCDRVIQERSRIMDEVLRR